MPCENDARPDNDYVQPYWDRLQKLDYEFLKDDVSEAIGIALRFTLGQQGVHTAIVGTTKPGRWRENAEMLQAGPLPAEQLDKIRSRWKSVAGSDWAGEV